MPYVGGSLTTFFDEVARALTAAAARAMADEGGKEIERVTTINTPVETGALRGSWHRAPTVPERAEGYPSYRSTVSTDVSYAPDVEYGTGLWGPKHAPYSITPRNPGGTLRFLGRDGRVVFAKHVLHPGSPGNHMLSIGMLWTQASIEDDTLFRGVLEEWVRGVEGGAH